MSLSISKVHALLIAVFIALTVLSPGVARAQIEKRVVFKKATRSAVYKGKLPRDSGYDAYFFPAKKNQTLTVKLSCDDPDAYIAVYELNELGPDEDAILANDQRAREWSGRLPISSEYSVQVYDATDNETSAAPYTIEISLR